MAQSRVWVTQSGKGDRSFWKPLDAFGLEALQAFADARAWGHSTMPTPDGNGLPLAALKGCGCRSRPYDLRHSYLTEALIAGGSLEALQTLSGHASTRTLRRYTKAGEDTIARNVVNALGVRLATQLRAPEPETATAAEPLPVAAAVGLSSEAVVSSQLIARSTLRLVVNHRHQTT